MGRRDFSQELVVMAGDPGSDYCHPFALPDETRFGKDVSFALVAKKIGIYVNCQGKTLALFAEFSGSDGQYGGGDVCHPDHGAGLHGAEWVACPWNHRHPADNAIFFAFFNKKF
jgi:hypothetical protein